MVPLPIDLEKICRLCFREDDGTSKMVSLYEQPSLEETIQKCVQVEVLLGTDEPTNICANCILILDSWTKFKALCDNTNAFVRQYIRDRNDPDLVLSSELANFSALGFTPSQMSDLSLSFFDNDTMWNNSILQQWSGEFDTDFPVVPKYTKKVQPPEDLNIHDESSNVDSESSKDDNNFIQTKAHWKNPKAISMKTMRKNKEKSTTENGKSESLKKYNRYVRKTYYCNICSETFSKFNVLIAHDMKVHTDLAKNFNCEKCGKLFLTKERLLTHETIHREKLFECKLCQKKFICQKTLDAHLNIHTGLYTCKKCGYRASNLGNLKIHESAHSLVKEHYCKECEKYFSTLSSLRRHDRLVHKKLVMFRCDQCDYSTSQPSNFKYHKSIHSSETCICDHCGACFKNQILLNFHLKIHDDSKFSCSHCDKLFKKKSTLKEHLSNSHNLGPKIKNFKCDACDNCFSRNRFLQIHKKKCHSS